MRAGDFVYAFRFSIARISRQNKYKPPPTKTTPKRNPNPIHIIMKVPLTIYRTPSRLGYYYFHLMLTYNKAF